MASMTIGKLQKLGLACGQMISILLLLLSVQDGGHAARIPRRLCQDSEIVAFSNRGFKIESVPQSRVEVSLVDVYSKARRITKDRFYLALDFKTTSRDGILFYGRSPFSPRNYVALTLQAGRLVYSIRCPTLHADLTLPTRDRQPLNDGHWHSINYTLIYSPVDSNEIVIDGYSNSKHYEVTCDPFKWVVVGGLRPKDAHHLRELESLRGKFEGCIKNLRIPPPIQKPPKYYAVSVCD